MDAFLDLLKFIFIGLLVGGGALIIGIWIDISINTYVTTKENNILIKDMCIKNGLNVDSLTNIIQNDTLIWNLKINTKEE